MDGESCCGIRHDEIEIDGAVRACGEGVDEFGFFDVKKDAGTSGKRGLTDSQSVDEVNFGAGFGSGDVDGVDGSGDTGDGIVHTEFVAEDARVDEGADDPVARGSELLGFFPSAGYGKNPVSDGVIPVVVSVNIFDDGRLILPSIFCLIICELNPDTESSFGKDDAELGEVEDVEETAVEFWVFESGDHAEGAGIDGPGLIHVIDDEGAFDGNGRPAEERIPENLRLPEFVAVRICRDGEYGHGDFVGNEARADEPVSAVHGIVVFGFFGMAILLREYW